MENRSGPRNPNLYRAGRVDMAPNIETMPQQPSVNGTRLFYELSRSGDPLVLVHGSWSIIRTGSSSSPA
jgi:hypothetical protein